MITSPQANHWTNRWFTGNLRHRDAQVTTLHLSLISKWGLKNKKTKTKTKQKSQKIKTQNTTKKRDRRVLLAENNRILIQVSFRLLSKILRSDPIEYYFIESLLNAKRFHSRKNSLGSAVCTTFCHRDRIVCRLVIRLNRLEILWWDFAMKHAGTVAIWRSTRVIDIIFIDTDWTNLFRWILIAFSTTLFLHISITLWLLWLW